RHAAHGKNFLAGAFERGMVGCKSSQLQSEICLHGSADVRRAGRIRAPTTVMILVVQNVASRLLEALLAARAEKHMKQDVVGFEGSIGLEFSAPVTLFVLLGEKIVARGID